MPRCCLVGGLLCGLLWTLFPPAPAAAGDLLGWLKGDQRSHTAEHLGDVEPGVAAAPGPQVSPGHTVYGPVHRYIRRVGSYNWGYFGAAYRPVHFCHKGYYGECSWWCYRRRY